MNIYEKELKEVLKKKKPVIPNCVSWFQAIEPKHFDTESLKTTATDLPPVEYVQVKHGRWVHWMTESVDDDIMGGEYQIERYLCSECGFDVAGQNGFNFCPNCGAKMEKECDTK